MLRMTMLVLVCYGASAPLTIAADEAKYQSHPPMRPLPVVSKRPLAKGPVRFVDPLKGSDRQDGTETSPWKTVAHAVQRLQAGDTLYLRGGTYYESVIVARVGSADKPITIRAYPGELAILDGGIREFHDDPAHAWEPTPQGADGEFRSTRTYMQGGGAGNFGDSMVPLHRYLTLNDLRSTNEFWTQTVGKRNDDPKGIYCGPGVYRDPETGRIHVRLAHTLLPGLGDHGYRGETDPRKLPLVVSGHDYTLRIEGARHLRIQDLVIRGGERSAVLITEDSEDTEQDAEAIELDGVTLYGTGSALQTRRTRGLRLVGCALRGHAAPWHSRAHHKYRAHAGYLVMAGGKDFEFAASEFTDHHDALQTYFVDGLRFHHNILDNFNDDGIEPGPKKERGRSYVYQNLITRILNPFTVHANKPNPIPCEEGAGVYVYRNIVDLRRGTYRGIPAAAEPSGAFLNSPTQLIAHDHGGPIHVPYYVYHNTFLMPTSVFRNYYAFSWGSHTRGTTRRVFNNIFVQIDGLPGLNFTGASVDDDFQSDGNLMWGVKEGPAQKGDFFTKFRKSSIFEASKKRYPPGWGAADLFADPKFVSLDGKPLPDVRLQKDSPAINAGVDIPAAWPDVLRMVDAGKPDIGAVPLGAELFPVGLAAAPPKQ